MTDWEGCPVLLRAWFSSNSSSVGIGPYKQMVCYYDYCPNDDIWELLDCICAYFVSMQENALNNHPY